MLLGVLYEGFAWKMSGAHRLTTRLESLIVVVSLSRLPSLEHLHGQIEMLIWKLPPSEAAGASRCFGLAWFSTFAPSIEFSPFFWRSSRIWTITVAFLFFQSAVVLGVTIHPWLCGNLSPARRSNSSGIRRPNVRSGTITVSWLGLRIRKRPVIATDPKVGLSPKKGIESGKNIEWEYRPAWSLGRWTTKRSFDVSNINLSRWRFNFSLLRRQITRWR